MDTVNPQTSVLFSMDNLGDVKQVAKILPESLRQISTTLVAFSHPLHDDGVVRALSVFLALLDRKLFQELVALRLDGIEAHCDKRHLDERQREMESVYFSCLHVVREVRSEYGTARDVAEIVI